MLIENITIEQLQVGAKAIEPKSRDEINDIRTAHLDDDFVSENMDILQQCRAYYDNLADFRSRRKRARNYMRGRQWEELTKNDKGEEVTESELIKSRGKIPFKQNVIRQLTRSILGQYISNKSQVTVVARKKNDAKEGEMLTNALQSAEEFNNVRNLDVRNLEEFIMSGSVIGKVIYDYWPEKDREDIKYENINPNTIFFNTDVKDPRLLDLRLIGEVKDTTLEKVIATFAENEEDEKKIKSWYAGVNPRYVLPNGNGLTADRLDNMGFWLPSDVNKVRLIEVWQKVSDWRTYAHDYADGSVTITDLTLEDIKAMNQQRMQLGSENGIPIDKIPMIDAWRKKEEFWVVKYLTPFGQCLYQGETVYKHQSHPYVMRLYPLIDGEVWGLVEDIIDQQRYINRMISLIDFVMGFAAKGVLLVPEEAIPEDMDIEDYAEEWSKFNGVIKFKAKNLKHLPQQISANVTNIGAQDMLQLQLKLIQEISGVSNAIQGQESKAGTPASLYAQQAQNSMTNIMDLFNTFNDFKKTRDEKTLKVIQQFYDDNRYIAIAGQQFSEEASYYDPDLVKDTDFDLVIADAQDTPAYRMLIDETLMKLFDSKAINVMTYLENSTMPFAQKILESMKKQSNQPGQGAAPNVPPEAIAEAEKNSNPKATDMINELLKH